MNVECYDLFFRIIYDVNQHSKYNIDDTLTKISRVWTVDEMSASSLTFADQPSRSSLPKP